MIKKKKEMYHCRITEVVNLLESAGFSHSNPYYVVQQGKIASLTLMKDSERLDLLKEIGGNKRNQIIQVVQERLRELDEEKAELKKHQQQLDKQRKSLEYTTIYDKEVNGARSELAEVDEERNAISEELIRKYNLSVEGEEEVKKLDKSYKDVTREVQGLSREKRGYREAAHKSYKKAH
ncbi:hypothetical protein M8C21_026198 [Ambrosia artemisiifolia]|uniref:Uncharacterized protein n=1 Tax=Ambrosia artemisiifolia TaxID=4212 RepID=A0AAD5GBM7_AMBAR|nr:hypothetical protein M8C21_026198 [Ambrosia artemisiifolia]